MSENFENFEITPELASKLSLGGIKTVADLLRNISDPDLNWNVMHLDFYDLQEMNEVFKRCDIATVLVPVPVSENDKTGSASPLPLLHETLAEVLGALARFSAVLAKIEGTATVTPPNISKGENG